MGGVYLWITLIGLHHSVRLVDGEVKGRPKVRVAPRLVLFGLERDATVAWHSPHDEYNTDDDEGEAYQ